MHEYHKDKYTLVLYFQVFLDSEHSRLSAHFQRISGMQSSATKISLYDRQRTAAATCFKRSI